MGLGIPPLRIKITLESNLLKPTMLVGRLGVVDTDLKQEHMNKKTTETDTRQW